MLNLRSCPHPRTSQRSPSMRWSFSPRTYPKFRHRNRLSRGRRAAFEPLESRRVPSGDFGFAVGLGGSGDDIVRSVAADNAGNSYVLGTFNGTVNFNPGGAAVQLTSAGGNADLFLAKYDASGALTWAKD